MLVGGLVAIFYFPRNIGNHHPNWLSYFSEGWPNHQPDQEVMKNRVFFFCELMLYIYIYMCFLGKQIHVLLHFPGIWFNFAPGFSLLRCGKPRPKTKEKHLHMVGALGESSFPTSPRAFGGTTIFSKAPKSECPISLLNPLDPITKPFKMIVLLPNPI